MRGKIVGALFFLAAVTPARADFERWSAEVDNDPFTKGQRVVVSYMSTVRSGVFIFCDSAKESFSVRAIPGFAYDQALEAMSPKMSFAIDGNVVLEDIDAETGSVGDNLAAAEVTLSANQASILVDAFMKAGKQVAIQDGISDQPHLLRARGSTKAGGALQKCLDLQGSEPAESTVSGEAQPGNARVFKFSNGNKAFDVYIFTATEQRAREMYEERWGKLTSQTFVTATDSAPSGVIVIKDTP